MGHSGRQVRSFGQVRAVFAKIDCVPTKQSMQVYKLYATTKKKYVGTFGQAEL